LGSGVYVYYIYILNNCQRLEAGSHKSDLRGANFIQLFDFHVVNHIKLFKKQ
jgi:hypothetical protein